MLKTSRLDISNRALAVGNRRLTIGPIEFSVSRYARNHGPVYQILWNDHFVLNFKTAPWVGIEN